MSFADPELVFSGVKHLTASFGSFELGVCEVPLEVDLDHSRAYLRLKEGRYLLGRIDTSDFDCEWDRQYARIDTSDADLDIYLRRTRGPHCSPEPTVFYLPTIDWHHTLEMELRFVVRNSDPGPEGNGVSALTYQMRNKTRFYSLHDCLHVNQGMILVPDSCTAVE